MAAIEDRRRHRAAPQARIKAYPVVGRDEQSAAKPASNGSPGRYRCVSNPIPIIVVSHVGISLGKMVADRVQIAHGPSRRRGRPVNVETGAMIRAATRDLLQKHGYGNITVDQIAERAGVSKMTVYRRYPSKPDIVFEALGEIIDQKPVVMPGRDIAEDLTLWVVGAIEKIGHPAVSGAMPGLLADCHGDAALVRRMRQVFFGARRVFSSSMFRKAIRKGQLRRDIDPDTLIDMVIGAIHYRLLFAGRPVDMPFAKRVVGYVLRAAGSRENSPPR